MALLKVLVAVSGVPLCSPAPFCCCLLGLRHGAVCSPNHALLFRTLAPLSPFVGALPRLVTRQVDRRVADRLAPHVRVCFGGFSGHGGFSRDSYPA